MFFKTMPLITGLILVVFSVGGQDYPEKKKFSYVAHRGASYLAPENTLASISLAWDLGADAVTTDRPAWLKENL